MRAFIVRSGRPTSGASRRRRAAKGQTKLITRASRRPRATPSMSRCCGAEGLAYGQPRRPRDSRPESASLVRRPCRRRASRDAGPRSGRATCKQFLHDFRRKPLATAAAIGQQVVQVGTKRGRVLPHAGHHVGDARILTQQGKRLDAARQLGDPPKVIGSGSPIGVCLRRRAIVCSGRRGPCARGSGPRLRRSRLASSALRVRTRDGGTSSILR